MKNLVIVISAVLINAFWFFHTVQPISINHLYETKLTQLGSYPEQIHLSYGSPGQMISNLGVILTNYFKA